MSGRQMSILIGLVVVIAIVSNALYVVNERERAVLLKFGEVVSTDIQPGLHFKIPFVDQISGRVSLRIQQLDVLVETKTKDDVFVKMKVSVQYQILKDKIYDALEILDSIFIFSSSVRSVRQPRIGISVGVSSPATIALPSELSTKL